LKLITQLKNPRINVQYLCDKSSKLLKIASILILVHTSKAQASFIQKRDKIRILTGVGFQYLGQILPLHDNSYGLGTPYDYRVTFFEMQYQRKLKNYKNSSIDLLLMPQFNSTTFKKEDENTLFQQGHEMGLNVGISIRKSPQNEPYSYYLALSSGPHYTSDTPGRQTPGFIFSDNLFVGIDYEVFTNTNVSFQLGFRHISNAGISNPNGGINNVTGKIGVSFGLF